MSGARITSYVNAMVELASAEGVLAEVASEMFQLAAAFETDEKLRAALTDQSVPMVNRQSIVEALLSSKANNVTVQLVAMVIGAGRARDLPGIAREFAERASQAGGADFAEVRSAVALSDDQRGRLASALSAKLGRKVDVKVVVDPSVVGGIVATVGDEIIDGSVRGNLDQLKARL
ncbi:MAG: synthase subunit delta [Actinomycetota bacterium]|jgi:F-type H+-transporting ATPase subunit delta